MWTARVPADMAARSFFLDRHSGGGFDTLTDPNRLDIDPESRALVLGAKHALLRESEDLHDRHRVPVGIGNHGLATSAWDLFDCSRHDPAPSDLRETGVQVVDDQRHDASTSPVRVSQ